MNPGATQDGRHDVQECRLGSLQDFKYVFDEHIGIKATYRDNIDSR